MSMKQQEKILGRFNEANVSVIDTANSHNLPAILSISVSERGTLYPLLKFLMKGLTFEVIFFKIRRQDQKDI